MCARNLERACVDFQSDGHDDDSANDHSGLQ